MDLLNEINSPSDLKKLNPKELKQLSKEIRRFLIKTISKTGGHLASNLGVVELTIALHYCFESPKDKIVWDVGHQSYVHKILTGRKDKFDTLRKYKGLSGFPKASESEHDVFDTGHSSTSISAALGYAISRDLNKEDYNVISVTGDGAITGGLAYEALNNAGRSNSNLIVVLNDNEMSISPNVGGITKHLNDIRSAPKYIEAKKDVQQFFKKIPVVGDKVSSIIEKTKDSIRYLLVPGVLFEELGFKYIGLIDGNNIEELIKVFNHAKKIKGPILLHVHTKKGKGYYHAQLSPENFHGISAFDIESGKVLKRKTENTYSDIFGEKLLSLAQTNKQIVAVTAAMPTGTGLKSFAENFPKRIFDVGIAEAHAVTFCAAMAKNSLIPVFAVYSTFLQRAYDQILHDVCIQNLHVVFAIDRAGIVGDDGDTHQGIFDISFLSHIPNMTIIAPKNKNELESMLDFAIEYNAPIAIRYPRGSASNVFEDIQNEIVYGKSELIIKGENIAIISVGAMMEVSIEVIKMLKNKNINATLINARFIKPIDLDMIKSFEKYNNIYILEDNVRQGGYYSSILNIVNEYNIKAKVHSFAFDDVFVEHGTREQLFIQHGLDAKTIYNKIFEDYSQNQKIEF